MRKGLCIALLAALLFSCQGSEQQHADEKQKPQTLPAAPKQDSPSSLPASIQRDSTSLKLVAVHIDIPSGPSYGLYIPKGYNITYVAHDLQRPRFMAFSPDHRLFLTDMASVADNSKGIIYILSGFDSTLMGFRKRYTYLDKLRNPNSLAFYTDQQGKNWVYIALTQALIRFPYQAGDTVPAAPADTLLRFPDWGNSYKIGGWHLTRTLSFHKDKLYISIGSSCNGCIEKEADRAGIICINPDGTGKAKIVSGLRNAVGMAWAGDTLYVTAMGADHLGKDAPDELIYKIVPGTCYGWPYYYEVHGEIKADEQFAHEPGKPAVASIPHAVARMDAHSAPLGIAWFDKSYGPALQNYFLVALHGSGAVTQKRGYKIVRTYPGCTQPQDFITGFLHDLQRDGRPCGILPAGNDAFFFTDDYKGVMFYVWKKEN